MCTTLDQALARWSVVCTQWSELAAGNAPILGAFLSGWYWRDMGRNLPPADQIGQYKDSFRKGWAEADTHIEIFTRHLNAPTEDPSPSAVDCFPLS